jgi:hypothetical protein
MLALRSSSPSREKLVISPPCLSFLTVACPLVGHGIKPQPFASSPLIVTPYAMTDDAQMRCCAEAIRA